MKDLTPIFDEEARTAKDRTFVEILQAIDLAARVGLPSTPEEWQRTPDGYRLCLQPGLTLEYLSKSEFQYDLPGLYLRRVKRNRQGKVIRGAELSSGPITSVTRLAAELRAWGYGP